MFKKIVRVLDRCLAAFENTGAMLAMIIPLVLVNLAIALRMTINYESSNWEEIARFAMLWMYFLGVSLVSRENSHIRMGFLDTKIKSPKTKLKMEIAFDFVCITVLFLFSWWSIEYLTWSLDKGQISLMLGVGMWTVQAAFVFGFCCATIRTLAKLVKDIHGFQDMMEAHR